MSRNTTEILVGTAVLAAAIGFLFYATQVTGAAGARSGMVDYTASFRSVEGISIGTDVRMSGVKVGSVSALDLNTENFRANARISVRGDVALPDDTAVVVASEGLLGGSFVELLPGGSPFNLEPGSEIEDTQGSVSIVQLLLKFVTGDSE